MYILVENSKIVFVLNKIISKKNLDYNHLLCSQTGWFLQSHTDMSTGYEWKREMRKYNISIIIFAIDLLYLRSILEEGTSGLLAYRLTSCILSRTTQAFSHFINSGDLKCRRCRSPARLEVCRCHWSFSSYVCTAGKKAKYMHITSPTGSANHPSSRCRCESWIDQYEGWLVFNNIFFYMYLVILVHYRDCYDPGKTDLILLFPIYCTGKRNTNKGLTLRDGDLLEMEKSTTHLSLL